MQGQKELESKFQQFDDLKSIKSDYTLKLKLAESFKDPTIWAYGTLFDKQNNRLKLWYYQDKIVNDKNRFIHVTAANQTGKSWAICIKAAHHALFVPNSSVMVISKSEQQATYILDEIKWLLRRGRIDCEEFVGEVENRTELHIKGINNGVSVIRCFPPTTTALGFPATLLLSDEGSFWEKISDLTPIEYYDQVLEPRTNMTKSWKHPFLTMGQIVFITNPNGQQGIAWRNFNQDSRFNNYQYCWLANPNNSLEDYNEAKKRLPSYRFASIYAAEYLNADGGFITLAQYELFSSWSHPLVIPVGSILYLGGDFAGEDVKSKNRDFNVLYGVVQDGLKVRVVYVREWPSGTKRKEIYDEIKRLRDSGVTIAKFCYDKVGVGDSVKNDLIEQNILNEYQIESLTYSLQNKSEIYINFQGLFEKGMIEGRDIHKLREQILALQVEQPEGSVHLKIHHKTEGIRDDQPDALANACWGAKRLSSPPVSFNFISREAKVEKDLTECRHDRLKPINFGELACIECGEER